MGGTGKPGLDSLGTGDTVSTGGIARADAGPTQDLIPGMMVGEYKIEGLLGEGGMGRVYSATHPVIAKRAAIKILHPELSKNSEAVERFAQEARSVNQIGHPNIVDIFAFGTLPDGRCYFVMEWLRGQSLRDRMRHAQVPLNDALAILETITIALEAAHEQGIVHRDLKPDNIFLVEVRGAPPTVKLLDFGIAKLLGTDESRVERTRTGNLLGTPAYISPEQARGKAVDHRTDIYALGALAYELFTGWLPFPADNAAEMLAQHLYQPPPSARERNPSISPELDRLVIAMLAKDPHQRPTLAQIRDEIRPYRHGMYATGPSAYAGPHTPPFGIHAPAAGLHPPMSGMQSSIPTPSGLHTPAPALHTPYAGPDRSVTAQTGMPGTTTTMQPARASRLPLILVVSLLAIALGGGVFYAMSRGSSEPQANTVDPAATPATDPAVDVTPPAVEDPPPVATDPATAANVTPPIDTTTKPVDTTTKPVDTTTKPVDTTTKPVDTTTKPVDTTTKPVDTTTKPADTTTKSTTRKRDRKRTKTTTKPPVDPDAPW